MRGSLEKRFWARTRKGSDAECWEWTAARDRKGYGLIKDTQTGRSVKAHRVSWQLHHGSIPDGMCVCHSCDNPSCVNPAHLWLGTNADNTADRDAKGHQRTSDQSGEHNPGHKLVLEEVGAIRAMYDQGSVTQASLARQYQVTGPEISMIVNRKRWARVP